MRNSVINVEAGLSCFLGNLENYCTAAARVLKQLPDSRRGLETMISAGEWKNVRTRARAIKSAARRIGALEVSATAAKLEKYSRNGEKTLITGAAALLGAEWDCAAAELTAWLEQQKSGALLKDGERFESPETREQIIARLHTALSRMNLVEAKKAAAALAADASDGEKPAWTEIETAVSRLDYKAADGLLHDIENKV